jgi:predicted ATP-binding protein involved in virulence
MSELGNPFEYEAANNLPTDKIATYFIDDFNYSRFINSTRNVVIVGDRGSGKTMALMFNSLAVQRHLSTDVPSRLGIYVPCKTVLMKKKEQELFEDPQYSTILSENFLTTSVLFHLVDNL